MTRPARWFAVIATFLAASAFAQVSPQYQNWGTSGIQYLMMKQEKIEWASLRTDAEAKAFIELFWARRDPTPQTPVNEARQQFESRIAEADKRYTLNKTPGSQTDHGLVYVALGEPSDILRRVLPPRAAPGTLGQFQRPTNVERWVYKNAAAERTIGTKAFEIAFDFHDEVYGGKYQLDEPSLRSFESTALNVAKTVIKRPFLTAEDLASGGVSDRMVPLRLIVLSDSAIAHDVLRRAQEGQDFAELARKYSSHPSAQQGGYVGRVPYADLTDDFKAALLGKKPGEAALLSRSPHFAVLQLLTEAEAAAAEAALPKPK
ncbi:MAG TPA: GWxTD domain-containing protein [Thermoanaerobaculia bacterium]|nr:GWxTD domain-containing protein [Thermoanaerobaculia bacterium]